MFPDAPTERGVKHIKELVKCLKDGGYIIYATCTFSLEENEMTVDNFLKSHPDFEIVEVKDTVKQNTVDGIAFDGCECENIKFARRFYPHKNKGEGQFMALLHNKNTTSSTYQKPTKKPLNNPTVITFLNDVLTDYKSENVIEMNGTPVYFTPDFEIKNTTVFSCGITIGEIKKNFLKPHHQFFMGMGDKFKRKIELSPDSEQIKKYLHGEEIETDCPDGWAVVTVDGSAVGGAKVVSGTAKNHYPKGLRIN